MKNGMVMTLSSSLARSIKDDRLVYGCQSAWIGEDMGREGSGSELEMESEVSISF